MASVLHVLLAGCAWVCLTPPLSEGQNVYRNVQIPDKAHFAEAFDSAPLNRNWIRSKADKVGENNLKYDGEWAVEEPEHQVLPGNRGLVMKSVGRHHAISSQLRSVYHFKDKPLCLQYEVHFQKGMDCGGAYIKLLSDHGSLQLAQFSDATPYSIMFGPDKCGSSHKVHFIFRHQNPLTGEYEEKQARQPAVDLADYFNDRKPHLYTLRLYPDNTYEILIDLAVISKGSLLEDMVPPVNPPLEVLDPEDTAPDDWEDRERIPDPTATKPQDWDEDAPELIPDPAAQRPDGWLEEEQPLIPDPEAQRPEDWSEDMDGEWEAPLVPNPVCAQAAGCGPWSPPMLRNAAYRGRWYPPMIDNPNYKGPWKPRSIPNPAYFEDLHPFRMAPVRAVGLELWSLTAGVLFDNILLCDDLAIAQHWTQDTWGQRKQAGVLEQLYVATMKRPWLWGVYVFSVGLPIILFVSFMWPDKRFGPPDQDYYYKKSDEPQPDGPQDLEGPHSLSDYGVTSRTGPRKRDVKRAQKKSDLELKVKE
ncbi:calnexin [Engraulis encrasicolus]|uniref:calnexin n=1 Tax=Engraulis encrasicolus TaxID=184585 RepID=UPI002FD1C5DE